MRTIDIKPISWIADDQNRLWLHAGFWLFLYIDELLAVFGWTEIPGVNAYTIIFFLFIDMCTVYFVLYVLVPTYLLTNRLFFFIAFSVITILVNIELLFLLRFELACVDCHLMQSDSVTNQLIADFASASFVVGAAIGANIMRRYVRSQMHVKALQTDTLTSELNFLKAQINPHFLFNSLNNIYVLTRKRPEEASESVLLLSDLMRYQLYDCAKDTVALSDEIEYLKNYLKLDKLRKSYTNVEFTVHGDPKGIRIPPFLFMPFVENAVTHGISQEEGSFIFIDIIIDRPGLTFHISNSKPQITKKKPNGGIGLANAKRRLELLYPQQHELRTEDHQDRYDVYLTISLKTTTQLKTTS